MDRGHPPAASLALVGGAGRAPYLLRVNFAVVEQLVGEALDRLPDWVLEVLAPVPILVNGGGREAGAYGLYQGDGVARDDVLDQIVIYGDTLLRDFGHDREPARGRGGAHPAPRDRPSPRLRGARRGRVGALTGGPIGHNAFRSSVATLRAK